MADGPSGSAAEYSSFEDGSPEDPWSEDVPEFGGGEDEHEDGSGRGRQGHAASLTEAVATMGSGRKIKPKGKSSMPSAIFNFVNSIVGAGIIGLPFALRQAGFWAGILLLALVALMVDYGVRVLVTCGKQEGISDLGELMAEYFGPRGLRACNVVMYIFAFGAMVAYLIIIGDTIPSVFMSFGYPKDHPIASRELAICVTATVVILPLSLLRDMSRLAWSSLLSVVADLTIVIIVAATASAEGAKQGIAENPEEPAFGFAKSHFAAGVGAISFAFVCHHSSFIVHNTLANPTPRRWNTVTHSSVGIAFALCLILAITGYSGFLDKTEGDVLNNYEDGGALPGISRLLLALTMVFTFPMEQFVCRHVIVTSCCRRRTGRAAMVEARPGDGGGRQQQPPQPPQPPQQSSCLVHVGVTVAQWLVSVGLALIFTDLGLILELTGSVAASMLGYIFPALCFFAHDGRHGPQPLAPALGGAPRRSGVVCSCTYSKAARYAPATFMLVFGVLLFFMGPITAILAAVQEGSANHTEIVR